MNTTARADITATSLASNGCPGHHRHSPCYLLAHGEQCWRVLIWQCIVVAVSNWQRSEEVDRLQMKILGTPHLAAACITLISVRLTDGRWHPTIRNKRVRPSIELVRPLLICIAIWWVIELKNRAPATTNEDRVANTDTWNDAVLTAPRLFRIILVLNRN